MKEILFDGQLDYKTFSEVEDNLSWKLILLLVIILIVIIYNFIRGRDLNIGIIILLFGGIFATISFYFANKYSIKKLFTKNTLSRKRISGTINNDFIEWHLYDNINIKLFWEMELGALIKNNVVTIYYSGDQRIFFHKSFFNDENDWKAFIDIVRMKRIAI